MTTIPGEFKKALQTKRRRQHRTRRIVLGSGLLVLLLTGVVTWLVWFSLVFIVTEVRVNGLSLLTEQQITDAAAAEFGGPLVARDVDVIRGWVVALAPVAKVCVERHFPYTIEITVTERTLTYVRMDGNAARWVDTNGVVFHEGGEMAQGIAEANIAVPDQRLLKDVAMVVLAAALMLGDRITLLQASAVDRIEIQLSDGNTAVWGNTEQSQVKTQAPPMLLSRDTSVYDVSVPNTPMTR